MKVITVENTAQLRVTTNPCGFVYVCVFCFFPMFSTVTLALVSAHSCLTSYRKSSCADNSLVKERDVNLCQCCLFVNEFLPKLNRGINLVELNNGSQFGESNGCCGAYRARSWTQIASLARAVKRKSSWHERASQVTSALSYFFILASQLFGFGPASPSLSRLRQIPVNGNSPRRMSSSA